MKTCEIIKKINFFFMKIPIWVYLIPYIMHVISVKLITDRFNKLKSQKPLYDIIASNTKNYSKYNHIPNYIIGFISIFILFPLIIEPNLNYFKSLFKYVSVLVFIRSITTFVTILPAQSKKCENKNNLLTYLNGHCIDKIYSGHTALSLLVVLLYYKYNTLPITFTNILLILQIITAFFLILTRSHYTIDVILAYIITFGVYIILNL